MFGHGKNVRKRFTREIGDRETILLFTDTLKTIVPDFEFCSRGQNPSKSNFNYALIEKTVGLIIC